MPPQKPPQLTDFRFFLMFFVNGAMHFVAIIVSLVNYFNTRKASMGTVPSTYYGAVSGILLYNLLFLGILIFYKLSPNNFFLLLLPSIFGAILIAVPFSYYVKLTTRNFQRLPWIYFTILSTICAAHFVAAMIIFYLGQMSGWAE